MLPSIENHFIAPGVGPSTQVNNEPKNFTKEELTPLNQPQKKVTKGSSTLFKVSVAVAAVVVGCFIYYYRNSFAYQVRQTIDDHFELSEKGPMNGSAASHHGSSFFGLGLGLCPNKIATWNYDMSFVKSVAKQDRSQAIEDAMTHIRAWGNENARFAYDIKLQWKPYGFDGDPAKTFILSARGC